MVSKTTADVLRKEAGVAVAQLVSCLPVLVPPRRNTPDVDDLRVLVLLGVPLVLVVLMTVGNTSSIDAISMMEHACALATHQYPNRFPHRGLKGASAQ